MRRFEELDWQSTAIGEISLRRRLEPTLQVEVYEVQAHVVPFDNHLTGGTPTNTVYVCAVDRNTP